MKSSFIAFCTIAISLASQARAQTEPYSGLSNISSKTNRNVNEAYGGVSDDDKVFNSVPSPSNNAIVSPGAKSDDQVDDYTEARDEPVDADDHAVNHPLLPGLLRRDLISDGFFGSLPVIGGDGLTNNEPGRAELPSGDLPPVSDDRGSKLVRRNLLDSLTHTLPLPKHKKTHQKSSKSKSDFLRRDLSDGMRSDLPRLDKKTLNNLHHRERSEEDLMLEEFTLDNVPEGIELPELGLDLSRLERRRHFFDQLSMSQNIPFDVTNSQNPSTQFFNQFPNGFMKIRRQASQD
ncbi:hypothetical protein CROQUDRAFT_717540 [Cronartium quercuum f. sp. fusiforme G11]|uniref:Uncharacterized protein n=1 Tax=Cronartium quercuum f. sp. fusiforme G11 TaxID=708437 RepID=A0A9P6T8M2_9BASI|nr:hypothetical protein CROQUDRAFT_717540 [Cronartium quercuum f. sp. fusiforme G11]